MNKVMLIIVCLAMLCIGAMAQENAVREEGFTITDAEKIYTLSLLWSEAKYNFVYFDQVPDLDWDAAYQEYIPKVLATNDAIEYYRVLIRFLALLDDGHTNVWLSNSLRSQFDRPQIMATEIEGKPVVNAVSEELAEQIPLGSEILAVDGIPVSQYLEEEVLPYVASSTQHVKLQLAIQGLTSGGYGLLTRKKGSLIKIRYRTPDGRELENDFACDRSDHENIEWVRPPRPSGLLDMRWVEDGIAYVALNSFNDSKIVSEFRSILSELYKAKGIIIDIRYNGGGSTGNGTAILNYFTDHELIGSKWRTREHRGAYYAWSKMNPESEYHDTYGTLNGWYEGSTMEMEFTQGRKIEAPVVVLIDYDTASAAEDFLIFADTLEQFTYVGRPTYGSTGQPIVYPLVGEGGARICSKRDTYPDGRDFVGYGIQPDVLATPTIASIAAGKDIMLETGLKTLKEKMNSGGEE